LRKHVGVQNRRDLVSHLRRDDDFAWPCDACQPCGQVDAVPVHVVTFDDHVGDLDPYAKQNLALGRDAKVLASLAGCEQIGLYVVHQAEPACDHTLLVLLDQADGFDDVDNQHRSD
jgi:hypothetical protein